MLSDKDKGNVARKDKNAVSADVSWRVRGEQRDSPLAFSGVSEGHKWEWSDEWHQKFFTTLFWHSQCEV